MTAAVPQDRQDACIIVSSFRKPGNLRRLLQQLSPLPLPILIARLPGRPEPGPLTERAEWVDVDASPSKPGSALEALLRRAQELRLTWAVSVDGDGKYAGDDIWRLLAVAALKRHSLVIGICRSRRHTWQQKMLRNLSNLWFWMETGVNIPDSRTRFRVYPVEAMNRLVIRSRGQAWDVESIIRASWGGLRLLALTADHSHERPPEVGFRNAEQFLALCGLHAYLIVRRLLPLPFRQVVDREKIVWPRGFRAKMRMVWDKYLWSPEETPAEAAVSIGFGVFVGLLPLWGWHTLISLYFAQRLHMNKVLVVAANYIPLPPLLPLVFYLGLVLGKFVLTGDWSWQWHWSEFSLTLARTRLKEFIVGSTLIALLGGTLAGVISHALIAFYRSAKVKIVN